MRPSSFSLIPGNRLSPKPRPTWRDGRLYPVDFSDALCRALFVQERRSIWLTDECAHAFALDGRLIFEKSGGPSAVGFTWQEMAAGRGAVWTHNHPRLSAFSVDDLQRAFEVQVAELRAVDPKWIYRMRDPDRWPTDKWAPMMRAIGTAIERAKGEGITDVQERNHLGMTAAANAVGMAYSRNPWSPPLGLLLVIRGWLIARTHLRSGAQPHLA